LTLRKSFSIIGIDPGSIKTGYGIINIEGNKFSHVENGLIVPDKGMEFKERVAYIFKGLNEIIEEFKPDLMAIEDIFMSKNANSALKLGHIRGVAMAAAALSNITVYEYTPTQVKKSVAGSGRAQKVQIQHMVKTMLGLRELPYEDAADALAVAITHSFSIR